jgi:hypothetical protein
MTIKEFMSTIDLIPEDARKYQKVLKKALYKFDTKAGHDAFCGKVFNSRRYSYDLKRKLVFAFAALPQSRLWGFRNLSGESLFVFMKESLYYAINYFNVESITALASNPEFTASIDTEFDTPRLIFTRFSLDKRVEKTMRVALIKRLFALDKMNIEIAVIIVSFNDAQALHEDMEYWSLYDRAILEWTRQTYDMGELPDSWVRKFLLDMVPPDFRIKHWLS